MQQSVLLMDHGIAWLYQEVQYNVGQTICYTLMSMHFLNIY